MVAMLHGLALLRAGAVEEAESWTDHACQVGYGSRYWAFYAAVRASAAAARGDFHASLRLPGTAKLLLPEFRALKKLLFLGYERTGEFEWAQALAREIHITEPDFGRRLLADKTPTVGVAILRRAMLDSATRLGLP